MLVKKVLMCRPLYFQVEYQINPWMMPGSVDPDLAMKQWENLVSIYKDLGIEVEVIDQVEGLPDMVFASDQGIGVGEKWLLSNFRYPERQGESSVYGKWYQSQGYDVIKLPSNIFFEGGGETVRWRDYVFVGSGFRSSLGVESFIRQNLDLDVVELELVDDRFYHLDTCMLAVNEETIMIYPEAFSKQSLAKLYKIVPNLIEICKEEAVKFGANSVVVGGDVVCHKGNEKFVRRVNLLGLKPKEVDVSEFIKAGGGVHCLTCVLE